MTTCAPGVLDKMACGTAPTALWTSPTPRGLPRLQAIAPSKCQQHPFLLSLDVAAGCPDRVGAGLDKGECGHPSVGLQLLGRMRRGPKAGGDHVTTRLSYRVESWLFMSPLKCSNFFSVSSLKEPPEGWAAGRQSLAKQMISPHPGWSGSPQQPWSHHPPAGGLRPPLCDAQGSN